MKNKNVIAPKKVVVAKKKVVTAKKKVKSKNIPLKGSFLLKNFILKKEWHNNHATIIKLEPFYKKDMDAFKRLIKHFDRATYLAFNSKYELEGMELTHYELTQDDGLVNCSFAYFMHEIITIVGEANKETFLLEYDLTVVNKIWL